MKLITHNHSFSNPLAIGSQISRTERSRSVKLAHCLSIFVLILTTNQINAQCGQKVNLQAGWEIAYSFPDQAMTAHHDINGKDFLYVASKEAGLRIYNLSDTTPSLVKTIPISSIDNLHVMSVSQSGNYLYLSLGDFFSSKQNTGVAIVDVTNPTTATLTDFWKNEPATQGTGMVQVEGNYAYAAGMGNGLFILDISDKSDIKFVSQFVPDISYPNPKSPDPLKYNARGLAVRNDVVYLSYDAGGIRIINVSNKAKPLETGRYSNPVLNDRPRAYNNLVLNDTLLYVAIDYCGMEVLSVKDTAKIRQVSWWNPWKCETPANNWFNSPGHTNEIAYDKDCKVVFMSSGKSEMHAVSVADPAKPDSCASFGNTTNSQGTWGLGLYKNKVYTAYIFVPLGIPFFSNWSGIKEIIWDNKCTNRTEGNLKVKKGFDLYPNPVLEGKVKLNTGEVANIVVEVYDYLGRKVYHESFETLSPGQKLDIGYLENGNYQVVLKAADRVETGRMVVAR
jgi:hypothetical protein